MIKTPAAKLLLLDDISDRAVQIGRPPLEAKVEKALLGLRAASPDPGDPCEFGMERANMQPGSAEWHAGFDDSGTELV